ncbi:hypothetical protein DRN52_03755 [Thermococci archaeon]|nr:MAG: hypothetical protein DRN52_03755 [Thermococci archaeon]
MKYTCITIIIKSGYVRDILRVEPPLLFQWNHWNRTIVASWYTARSKQNPPKLLISLVYKLDYPYLEVQIHTWEERILHPLHWKQGGPTLLGDAAPV